MTYQTKAERKQEALDKGKVLAWMRRNAEHHDNATSLAEEAAHYALPEEHDVWLDDDTHWVWDLAIQVLPTR